MPTHECIVYVQLLNFNYMVGGGSDQVLRVNKSEFVGEFV